MHPVWTNSRLVTGCSPTTALLKPARHRGKETNSSWVFGCRHVVWPDRARVSWMDAWNATLHFPAGFGWIWTVHIAVQQNTTCKYDISKTTAHLTAATFPNYVINTKCQAKEQSALEETSFPLEQMLQKEPLQSRPKDPKGPIWPNDPFPFYWHFCDKFWVIIMHFQISSRSGISWNLPVVASYWSVFHILNRETLSWVSCSVICIIFLINPSPACSMLNSVSSLGYIP